MREGWKRTSGHLNRSAPMVMTCPSKEGDGEAIDRQRKREEERETSERQSEREREREMMRGGRQYAGSETCSGRGASCMALMGDCVCSMSDAISFGVGLASVFCWAVAEIPQIVSSFREGSTEGISVAFLSTWVVGDVFNLVGCYIEPSTLPTQLYTALLYTITTLILLGQVIYYRHILQWRKRRMVTPSPPIKQEDEAKEVYKPLERKEVKPGLPQAISQPIAYAPSLASTPGRERYYMSARSLASSHTPTKGSYLAAGSRGASGGRSNYLLQHHSVEDFQGSHPIPISINTSRSAPAPVNDGFSPSMLRAVVSIAMCVGGLNIGRGLMMKQNNETLLHTSGNVARVYSGRRLFQSELHAQIFSGTLHQESEMSGSMGVWLGWMMAAIYMGGRLPQIWLNIKRGSVEGLNPLMFTFALVGNVTYMGSILIRSAKWENISSNMPWLVDAGVCVLLDFFILCQFIYYFTRKQKDASDDSGGKYKLLE